jgi:Protein of unknown function (DUF3592)
MSKRKRKPAPVVPETFDGPEKIIIPLFGGIALLLLSIAGISSFLGYRQLASELSAPGRVVELVLRQQVSTVDRAESTADGRSVLGPSDRKITVAQGYYYPVVEFKLPDGQLKTVQLEQGSWPAPYEKGDPVTVRYESGRPLKAHIQSTGNTVGHFILPMILAPLGLIFLAVSGSLVYFGRSTSSTSDSGLTDPDR